MAYDFNDFVPVPVPESSSNVTIQSYTLFGNWKCGACGSQVKAYEPHGIEQGCLCPYPLFEGIAAYNATPCAECADLNNKLSRLRQQNAALRSTLTRIRGMLESVGLTI
jgi:hypothetical protein